MGEQHSSNPADPYERLTVRETQVIERLAAGDSNKELAARLGITFPTAKFYVSQLLVKVGARSRTEAACEWTRRAHP